MKRICWLLILIVLIAFSGCTEEAEPVGMTQDEEAIEVIEDEVPKAEPVEGQEEIQEQEEEKQPLEWDLLKGIVAHEYETLLVETELSGERGLVARTTAYYKEMNMRTETQVPDQQKYVMIVRGQEGYSYQYTDGIDKGIMLKHEGTEGMMNSEIEQGMEAPDLEEIRGKFDENMIVREDLLDGQEVIYVEFSEMGDVLNQVVVKLWFLKANGYPMRQEMYSDDKLLMRSKVTRLEMNIELEDSLFEPPENVDFIEIISMNDFGMPEVPEN